MSSDEDYLNNLVNKLKARDEQRNADFQRAQYEEGRQKSEADITFRALTNWLRDMTTRMNEAMARKVVRYQENPDGLRLIGEGGQSNILDINVTPKGVIVYKSALGEAASGGFYPEISNGHDVLFKQGTHVVTVEDMGKKLIFILTGAQ